MSFNNIASTNSTGGATTSITITAASAISSGQLLVLGICTESSISAVSSATTVIDSAGNSYTKLISANSTNTWAFSAWYAFNSIALASGNTITITATNTTRWAVSICGTSQANTSSDPTDVSTSASFSASNPSITSPTPTASNNLFVGFLGTGNGSPTFTEAAGWVTPPASAVDGKSGHETGIFGGNLTAASTSAQTFNPTLSLANQGVISIMSFKQPAAVVGTSQLQFYPNFMDIFPYKTTIVSY